MSTPSRQAVLGTVSTWLRLASVVVGVALGVALLGASQAQRAEADAPARTAARSAGVPAPKATPDVICGEIIAHQRFKARISDRPLPERMRIHADAGIPLGEPDSESVAVYVRERLNEVEIDALAPQGLRINRSLFVPPVGRHQHGYHLARMDYASMDRVRADGRFVRVTSAEFLLEPEHDIALDFVHILPVHAGNGVGPFLGTGVTVAVGDSGVDLSHPDLPKPIVAFDVTTGEWEDTWSTEVANTVIWHGTHVTGTVVGSGLLSGGQYRGGAPAADLVVHKIGNDFNGNSTYADMIKSVSHAAAIGADVYTVSYGGYDTYLDGSSAIAQAFDAAFEAGTLCFSSAGNSAQRRRHYSVNLPPGGGTDEFVMVLNNSTQDRYTSPISLRVIWRDAEVHDDLNVVLECLTLAEDEDEEFELVFEDTSPRNTEAKRYVLWPNVPPQTSRSYTLRLTNGAETGSVPLVHVYQVSTNVATFPEADPLYTVGSPAEADTVLAVGAWAHRKNWTDYLGVNRQSSQTLDTLATFSSRGPRIDGVLKPDIVAPGSMTISLRDGVFANSNASTISNDGVNDGSGPADYYIAQGTSMASPLAAAGAALVREAFPNMPTPQLRDRLLATASHANAPNVEVGFGMIDVFAAVAPVFGDLNGDGQVDGADLGVLLSAWGPCAGCPADLNDDGSVDGADLGLLLGAWGID